VISRDIATTTWSLIIFSRWPVAGRTKTRLIPSYGAEGAASIHRQLIERTVATVKLLPPTAQVVVAIAEPPLGIDTSVLFDAQWPQLIQRGIDLGERMANAIDDSLGLSPDAQSIVLIGVDCPEYSSELLQQAAISLQSSDIVFAPTEDGGYGLIGLRSRHWNSQTRCALFENISWGTSSVMQASLAQIKAFVPELKAAMLQTIWDVDTYEDVERAITLHAIRLGSH
jgi:uncharacterized protein